MMVHFCFRTCDAYQTLDFSINLLLLASRGMVSMDMLGQRETAKFAAVKIRDEGRSIGWELSDHIKTETLISDLTSGSKLSTETMLRELEGLKTSFWLALQKTKFAYLPPPDDKYFENDRLFGEVVFEVFAEARQDIKDAGNCLASALYTACVFHLMRASEFGLRRLATKLKVRLIDKGKPQYLEYATWDKVIERVHGKIKEARQLRIGPRKEAKLIRLGEAGDHCTFMKDIWRNNVSHTRKPYIREEAIGAFNRVNDFMNFLAHGLDEKKND